MNIFDHRWELAELDDGLNSVEHIEISTIKELEHIESSTGAIEPRMLRTGMWTCDLYYTISGNHELLALIIVKGSELDKEVTRMMKIRSI